MKGSFGSGTKILSVNLVREEVLGFPNSPIYDSPNSDNNRRSISAGRSERFRFDLKTTRGSPCTENGCLKPPMNIVSIHPQETKTLCLSDDRKVYELKQKGTGYSYEEIKSFGRVKKIATSGDRGAIIKDDGQLYTWDNRETKSSEISLNHEPILSTFDILDVALSNCSCDNEDANLGSVIRGAYTQDDHKQFQITQANSPPNLLPQTPTGSESNKEIVIITNEGEVVKQRTYPNGIICRVIVTPKQQTTIDNDSPMFLESNELITHISMGESHFSALTSSGRGIVCVDSHHRCVPWGTDKVSVIKTSRMISPNSQPPYAASPWVISPYSKDSPPSTILSAKRSGIVSVANDLLKPVLEPTGVYIDGMRGYKMGFAVRDILSCGKYIVAISYSHDMWVWKVVDEDSSEARGKLNIPCLNNVVSCGTSSKKIVALTEDSVHVFLTQGNRSLEEHVKPLRQVTELVKLYRCVSVSVCVTPNDILIHATSRKSFDAIMGSPISSSPGLSDESMLSDAFESPHGGACSPEQKKTMPKEQRHKRRTEIQWWLSVLKLNDVGKIIDHLRCEAHVFGSRHKLDADVARGLLREANGRIDSALLLLDSSEQPSSSSSSLSSSSFTADAKKCHNYDTGSAGSSVSDVYGELFKYTADLQMYKNIQFVKTFTEELPRTEHKYSRT